MQMPMPMSMQMKKVKAMHIIGSAMENLSIEKIQLHIAPTLLLLQLPRYRRIQRSIQEWEEVHNKAHDWW